MKDFDLEEILSLPYERPGELSEEEENPSVEIKTPPSTISVFDLFGSDAEKSENGIWFYPRDDVGFKLRRIGSEHTLRTRRKLEKIYEKKLHTTDFDEKTTEEITLKLVAISIIADWKGVCGADNKPLPPTFTNIYNVLLKLPFLTADLINESMEDENYKKDLDRKTEKN